MAMRWGIIGLGDIAERHGVPALALARDTELVAVLSRSMEKAQAFAAKHGVARAYDSLEKMLADKELDAIYIATPNNLHADQTVAAARAGKHVLCEKPMAITEPDCERMIQACDAHKVKLGVVFHNRYSPAHQEARRHVQAGVLGEIQLVRAQLCVGYRGRRWQGWRNDPAAAGSGAIAAQGVHPVDLLRFLMDSEVVEVRSMIDELPPERPVDDMVYSLLKFKNGAHGIVVAGILIPFPDNDVSLYGSKGKIICRGTLGTPVKGVRREVVVAGNFPEIRTEFPPESAQQINMARLIEDFNQSVLDDTEPPLSGRNGLQMVKIANAMLESGRHGKAVRLD